MNYKFKCIAVDDEPLALQLIENYIERTNELELVASYNNGIQALARAMNGDIDIVFSDIQMPGMDGIEFAKQLPKSTFVIFLTAFPQYALKGFEVDAIDYLVKPVKYLDFRKAAYKAINFVKGMRLLEADNYITIRSNYQLVRIATNDIVYVEALKDYMRVVTTQNSYMTLITLKQLSKSLPEDKFIRVHRSFVVQKRFINNYSAGGIKIDKTIIPVSDNYKPVVVALVKGEN